ncbi:hypothetical protein [Alteribacter aurantiacus]|uniref:hypothetical protein n=1 Tax=Alteribacter aurantiacus TaxID=254410 RepID=UPI00042554CF|nr:hypothetical protein [Alteribacter aurantiacus]
MAVVSYVYFVSLNERSARTVPMLPLILLSIILTAFLIMFSYFSKKVGEVNRYVFIYTIGFISVLAIYVWMVR